MTELEAIFPYLDRIMQWVVLPALAVLWAHNRKHGEHEKRFIEQQGEIRSVLAVLEVWKSQRAEDLRNSAKATERLTTAVEKLNDRLDRLADWQRTQP